MSEDKETLEKSTEETPQSDKEKEYQETEREFEERKFQLARMKAKYSFIISLAAIISILILVLVFASIKYGTIVQVMLSLIACFFGGIGLGLFLAKRERPLKGDKRK